MYSMTGYGKAKKIKGNLELSVEVKSVNSRYLDLAIRLPGNLTFLEMSVRDIVKKAIQRGKVSIFVNVKRAVNSNEETGIDQDRFRERFNLLQSLKETLKIHEEITLSHILSFPDLFEIDTDTLDPKEIQSLLESVLEEALEAFNSMRKEEGIFLLKDMRERIDIIVDRLNQIEKYSKLNVGDEFKRLLTNVENLVSERKFDRSRLEQEIAIISDRVDITEECVRMESHIKLFKETLKNEVEIGKKLNFILQEMLREANTMNSKTSNIEVSHDVIRIKEEIEKLREQTQNIE
jgi:uncharacterized protein (TIGR00255 family)